MDDEKVREIFFRHLKDNNVNESFAEAYREMGENILADIYEGQVVDTAVRELLLKIIRSMARLNLFSPYLEEKPETDTVSFGPEFFADISFFLQTWKDVLAHIIANFGQLMSERVRARHNIEDFKLMMSDIDQQVDEQVKNIIESGHIILKGTEFNAIRIKLTWGLYSLMGKDNFDKFRAELNTHLCP